MERIILLMVIGISPILAKAYTNPRWPRSLLDRLHCAPDDQAFLYNCLIQTDNGVVSARIRPGRTSHGSILILIHGGPGLTNQYMKPLDNSIAGDDWTIVDYEQRAPETTQPKTAWLSHANTRSITLDDLVSDLESLRLALEAKKIHLLGHSFGSIIAQSYATEYPDQVESLVLADGVPASIGKGDRSQVDSSVQYFKNRAAALGIYVHSLHFDDSCTSLFQSVFPVYFYDPKAMISIDLLETKCSFQVFNSIWRSIAAKGTAFDLTPGLTNYHGRALVVSGANDPFEGLASDLPHITTLFANEFHPPAPVILIQNAGHFPWLEPSPARDHFISTVRQFLGAQ